MQNNFIEEEIAIDWEQASFLSSIQFVHKNILQLSYFCCRQAANAAAAAVVVVAAAAAALNSVTDFEPNPYAIRKKKNSMKASIGFPFLQVAIFWHPPNTLRNFLTFLEPKKT